jgi:hypothetical protein
MYIHTYKHMYVHTYIRMEYIRIYVLVDLLGRIIYIHTTHIHTHTVSLK